ncbi:Kunitz/Bovine pancreatic trypsin inhibitor domain protein [Ancylostoma caninum]|uniref:Kunitz/Bovine pancreatic trypsin inhibitor domain protein n=1 Tax=Ancylostoma caninum TaxID=29170 RepID=A0A368H2U7_ANCCA|nr:Kunitz/Bovine pancreatic trypsin inhibitor domain protein [Ancylostoma caninum]
MWLSLIVLVCVLSYCSAEEYDGLKCKEPTAIGENCKSPKMRFTYDKSTGECKEVKCCKECGKTKNKFNTYQECSGSCIIF